MQALNLTSSWRDNTLNGLMGNCRLYNKVTAIVRKTSVSMCMTLCVLNSASQFVQNIDKLIF